MTKDSEAIIEADQLSVRLADKVILNGISFTFYKGQAWAVVGDSGSGKTLLGKIIAGLTPISSGTLTFLLPASHKRLMINQQHDFRDLSSGRTYYQQRFDSNYGNDSPLVEDALLHSLKKTDHQQTYTELRNLSGLLKIDHLLKSRLIELSNGEGKRVQLARALLQKPEIIVFDNPFLGLDPDARKILHEIINHLIRTGILIFIITTPEEIPAEVTHVLEMKEGTLKNLYSLSEFREQFRNKKLSTEFPFLNSGILQNIEPPNPAEDNFSIAVEMKEVSVSYGDKKILEGVNWKIKKGERWALLGPNGAGKSTLLSLINGDNPQAYSNEIYLFDQKRGSGESIWDIKRKIGYISPELHIYFQRNTSHTEAVSVSSGVNDLHGYSIPGTTCFEAIASGFNDQVGSSQKISPMEIRQVNCWMDLFQILPLRNQSLYSVSLGTQRFVLLARALVKNPAMLILDEPCQGLDKTQTLQFMNVVDTICDYFGKTLIYVSHYKEDIPSCVTKLLVLEKGKVKEEIHT
jgi:molybdate transport system ATP-binding protein